MDDFYKHQQEAISEALQELCCGDDGVTRAHEAIVGAIDLWLNYHEDEAYKWRELKKKVTSGHR